MRTEVILMSDTDNGQTASVRDTFADEKSCTEFTTEHGLTNPPDAFCFGFVCPQCGRTNPLKGNPAEFRSQPVRCFGCTWVSVLDERALERFAGGVRDDE